jgi:hypothetical protein
MELPVLMDVPVAGASMVPARLLDEATTGATRLARAAMEVDRKHMEWKPNCYGKGNR